MSAGNDFSADLYRHYSASLRKGVDSVDFESFPVSDQLRANVSRFAAYKAHHVSGKLRDILTDDQIAAKDRNNQAKALLKKFDRWHDAEYSTTVARSRTAKQFSEFMQPDSMRLFPNLRWLPSRSVDLRVEHTAFYNRVWPKDDPFWQSNSPGTLWNCKCDVEETDDGTTNNKDVREIKPPAGLEGNPAFTGEVFTDRASYIAKNKPFRVPGDEFKNLNTLVNNNTKKWRVDYYTDNEGILQTSRKRIKESELNKQELEKFEKEHTMSLTLAKNGHRIVYRETIQGSFDIFMNDRPAELKKTKSHNHIVDYAKKAIREQGAEMVVFEFGKMTPEIYQELNKLGKLGIEAKYFVTNENKVYNL
ncbi:MAG: hypothetical protein ACNA7V_09395 [Bacteroidales bacterium]